MYSLVYYIWLSIPLPYTALLSSLRFNSTSTLYRINTAPIQLCENIPVLQDLHEDCVWFAFSPTEYTTPAPNVRGVALGSRYTPYFLGVYTDLEQTYIYNPLFPWCATPSLSGTKATIPQDAPISATIHDIKGNLPQAIYGIYTCPSSAHRYLGITFKISKKKLILTSPYSLTQTLSSYSKLNISVTPLSLLYRRIHSLQPLPTNVFLPTWRLENPQLPPRLSLLILVQKSLLMWLSLPPHPRPYLEFLYPLPPLSLIKHIKIPLKIPKICSQNSHLTCSCKVIHQFHILNQVNLQALKPQYFQQPSNIRYQHRSLYQHHYMKQLTLPLDISQVF